jgi:hypothetical protein
LTPFSCCLSDQSFDVMGARRHLLGPDAWLRHPLGGDQPLATPNVATILEDVRTRGDRQHPFWAKIEWPNASASATD